MALRLPLLDDAHFTFPDPQHALDEPNGLLAFGGDLHWQRLLEAYRHGIFPWFGEGDPLLWWSPSPRCVFPVDDYRPSRTLRKLWRKSRFTVSTDTCFADVIAGCQAPRPNEPDTWITAEMAESYQQLAAHGYAHSIEVWQDNQLIGGLYGVLVGRIFCGESMFSRLSDASKIAFMTLMQIAKKIAIKWVDGQMENPHLTNLGGQLCDRTLFLTQLSRWRDQPVQWPQPGAITRDPALFS